MQTLSHCPHALLDQMLDKPTKTLQTSIKYVVLNTLTTEKNKTAFCGKTAALAL